MRLPQDLQTRPRLTVNVPDNAMGSIVILVRRSKRQQDIR